MVERLINILVIVTLVEMMSTIGLSVTLADLRNVFRDWRFTTGAMAANYVVVPAATIGLLLLFNPHPLVSIGFLIVAVCPGAPYGPVLTKAAKGDVARSVGLMVLLSGSSAILGPLLIRLLAPLIVKDASIEIDAVKVVATLSLTQLLPLSAGMAVRRFFPQRAEKLQRPAAALSKLLNLCAVCAIVAVQFHQLAEIRLRGFAGMLMLLAASLFAGWLLGGRESSGRKACACTTGIRNTSVGLVIAAGSFPGSPAVTAVAAYGLVSLIAALGIAFVAGRLTPSRPPPELPNG
jgi:BASS family bile acid:Na+ symporter